MKEVIIFPVFIGRKKIDCSTIRNTRGEWINLLSEFNGDVFVEGMEEFIVEKLSGKFGQTVFEFPRFPADGKSAVGLFISLTVNQDRERMELQLSVDEADVKMFSLYQIFVTGDIELDETEKRLVGFKIDKLMFTNPATKGDEVRINVL
jgi:hypothetical protein